MCVILGIQPDVPTEVNENGGRQSATPYAFHFLPPHAMFAAAEVAKYGAEKYGETLFDRNNIYIKGSQVMSDRTEAALSDFATSRG